jgi:hypothetical protein
MRKIPPPFPEKMLTEDVEDALARRLDECRISKPASLAIELPEKDLARVILHSGADVYGHHMEWKRAV